jgi:hypothetical protein
MSVARKVDSLGVPCLAGSTLGGLVTFGGACVVGPEDGF